MWVLYSFTRDMRRFLPEMYAFLREEYDLAATFPGTLGDGTLYVVRREGMGPDRPTPDAAIRN